MLRLRTLGGLSVERDGIPIEATLQRRALALLALLATSGGGGFSRDRLVALFWPESDEAQGRNALRQVLFRVRRDLHDADVVLGTTELRLNHAVVSSDVAGFEAALDAGATERAVALYRGPFLDGFHLAGADEFERWAEAQRDRLARRAMDALETLAGDALQREDFDAAAGWWRRRAASEPLNSRVAQALIRALVAAGDQAGALAHAQIHEALLREELGMPPDPAVAQLVARLRTPPPAAAVPGPQPAVPADAPADAPAGDLPAAPVPAEDPPPASVAVSPVGTARRRWPRVAPVAMLCASIVFGLLRSREARPTEHVHAADSTVVAVLPFAVHGAPAHAYLREGLVDLLSAKLDGAGAVRSVAPQSVLDATGGGPDAVTADRGHDIAARVGADRFVLGDVLEEGGRLHVTSALYDAVGRTLAQTEVDGAPDSLPQLVDVLTARLLAALHGGRDEELLRAAAVTTTSLPALRAYLDGEREFRAARYAAAADAFQRATREDSGYALAYYRLSVAQEWGGAPDGGAAAAQRAARDAERLPLHFRALLQATAARHRGDLDFADQRYRGIVHLYPDDADAWYQLGELAFHYEPLHGIRLAEARRPFRRVLDVRPDDREALVHLLRIAAREGDVRELDSLAARLRLLDDSAAWREALWLRALVRRDRAAIDRTVGDLAQAVDEAVAVALREAVTYGRDLDAAAALAQLLVARQRDPGYRATGYTAGAELALAHGRWREALGALGAHDGLPATWGTERRAILVTLPFLPVPATVLQAERRELASLPVREGAVVGDVYAGRGGVLRPYVVGLLAARLGDTAAVASQAAALDRAPPDSELPHVLARTLRALDERAHGRVERALALLDADPLRLRLGDRLDLIGSLGYQRWLRAEWLHELGRDDEAERWYDTFADASVHDVVYLAPAQLRLGEIAERRGARQIAAAHYRWFAELWRGCDAELRPAVRAALQRVAPAPR